MDTSKFKLSIKEVCAIVGFLGVLGATWYDMKTDVAVLKTEMKFMTESLKSTKSSMTKLNDQMQGVLGYAITKGWRPDGAWLQPSTEESNNS